MAKKSDGGAVTVFTIPLKTRPYERDTLDSRYRICCSIYNAMLSERMKAYDEMCSVPEYAEAKEITDAVTKLKKDDVTAEDIQRAKDLRKSGEYKKALDTKKEYHTQFGFSEFSFTSLMAKHREYFKDVIPSNLAILSIATPMWSAFEKLLYKDGRSCSYKRRGDWTSIATNGKSGMRIVDGLGKTALCLEKGTRYFISVTSKKGKQLLIPVNIDKKDTYLEEIYGRSIKIVRLVRKLVKGKSAYLLQLTTEGKPPVKYDSNGDLVHPIGEGRISVFTDEKYFTVATESGDIIEIDISFPSYYNDRKAEILQKMDESKRVSNPQNINPDGTFKNRKDNPSEQLVWHFSKTYRRYRQAKADIDRKEREARKVRSNVIASRILALGNDISINVRPFRTNVGSGAYKDNITRNAPSQILTVLKQKMKAAGLDEPHEYKLSVKKEDKKRDGYRADYAKELLHIRLQDLGEAE